MTVDSIQEESVEKAKNYILKKARLNRLKKRKIAKRGYTIFLILFLMFTSIFILFFF